MKKIILAICVIATLASCKKSKDDITCEVSVAGISASYKITKVVAYFPSPLPDQDITSSILTSCELAGIYQMKSDKTVVYTETAACGGTGTGTWDVAAGKLSMSAGAVDFVNVTVTGWDCGTLTLSEESGSGVGTRYTFSKQ